MFSFVSSRIQDLSRCGVIKQLKKRWFQETAEETSENITEPLGLSKLFILFVALFFGMACAVTFFIIEVVYKRTENRSDQ